MKNNISVVLIARFLRRRKQMEKEVEEKDREKETVDVKKKTEEKVKG